MAAPRTTEDVARETTIGPAISVRGRIEGAEDLRVEGRIEGSISLTETLYVEPTGVVIAEVQARDVVVSGVIIGNVKAINSVTLNKGAKLIGNIHSPRLIIADGAAFRGDVAMEGEDIPTARERTRATATIPRGAVGTRGGTTTRRGTVSGSYETRKSGATTTSTGSSTPRTPPAPPARSTAPSPRPAPLRTRPASGRPVDEDEVTVVIKHSALKKGELPPEEDEEGPRRAKKAARIPARGRRKATRR